MQQLIFGEQELEYKKLVFDYNILKGSMVDLQLPPDMHAPLSYWIARTINITILILTGKTVLIRVKGTDTIGDVKLRIQNVEYLAPGWHSKPGSEQNF